MTKENENNGLSIYICAILCIAAIIFSGCYIAERENNYYAYANTLDLAEIINSNELTIEDLENRNGKLIIECVIGVVEDAKTGAGRVLDSDPNYYYISYKRVDGIESGDVVCTYLIYNPDNNYCDDIIERFDYIIERGNKNDF